MSKKDLIDLINKFVSETWHYENSDSDELYNDMINIDSIENEIKNENESNLNELYKKLVALIGIIRFKHGYESLIIKSNPGLRNLNEIINSFSLVSGDIIEQYNYISMVYNNYISKNKDLSFIVNKYTDVSGKEGLYLTVESLKSLITNDEYRKLLNSNQINEIILDCVKLNNGIIDIKSLESKYKGLISKIWENSLSNKVDDNKNFRFLFSNISNDINLRLQAERLINRSGQSSCSMISSKFIATYQGATRRIGFIYPNNSSILMASAYDLYSRDGNVGPKNKEKGTAIVTPEVLEKEGIKIAKEKGDDIYSSTCYNEVIVNNDETKPCGIVVIGLGENDLNVDYYDARMLSLEMKLPIYYIDTMDYKNDLSEVDKYYIAFHSLMSFFGMTREELSQKEQEIMKIENLIDTYKNQISEIFLMLKKSGNLNKENMCRMIKEKLDIKEAIENNNMHR